MTITNYGGNRIALLIGGSITNIPESFFIGTGSGIPKLTDTTLIDGKDVQKFTSTTYPSSTKITYQGDWNSIEMSGIQLREFGIGTGSIATGSIWSRTSLPALNFDGTNELRIIENWEVLVQ